MHTIHNSAVSNKNQAHYFCPHCNSSQTIRYGTYSRAHPEKNAQVNVQRYLCKSTRCSRVTFSILKYPFLPIVQHFYQTLLFFRTLANRDRLTQAEISRRLGISRGRVKRLLEFTKKFIPWLQQESKIAIWSGDPASHWQYFTRDFSQSFYLRRCWKMVPT